MNRKLIIAILYVSLLLVGCSSTADRVASPLPSFTPIHESMDINSKGKATPDESKVQKPTPETITVGGGTKHLTIDIVKELAKKGENLKWEDFNDYIGKDIGSGLYIISYPIDEKFHLKIGSLPGKLDYAKLCKTGTENSIDIRSGDIDKFISE